MAEVEARDARIAVHLHRLADEAVERLADLRERLAERDLHVLPLQVARPLGQERRSKALRQRLARHRGASSLPRVAALRGVRHREVHGEVEVLLDVVLRGHGRLAVAVHDLRVQAERSKRADVV